MRGDIYSPFAGRAKEYSWSLCVENAPRKITPTDIDYMVECAGHFLFFEMKQESATMPYGQRLALERLLSALVGKAVLMLVIHSSVSPVTIPIDVLSVALWTGSKAGIKTLPNLPATLFNELYAAFFVWAEGDREAFKRVLANQG